MEPKPIGSYVRKEEQIGVICQTTKEVGYVYVKWLTNWCESHQIVQYYMERVSTDTLQEISLVEITPGLSALRRKVLR